VLLLAALAGGAAATYWYLNHVGGSALAGTHAAESKPAAQSEPAKEEKEAKEGNQAKGEKEAKGEKDEHAEGKGEAKGEGKGEKEEPPVAKVQVAPLRMEKIDETVTAFGTVQAAAEEVQILNVQFECRVRRLHVVSGQSVEPDQALAEVEPSPDARFQREQARLDVESAKVLLGLARQRTEMKLATKQDLLQAEQVLASAELKLAAIEKRGGEGPVTVKAAAKGVVSKIDVQQGQIVLAGAALVETIGENQITVRLNAESGESGRVKAGQAVRIEPVDNRREFFQGQVRTVTQEINPLTRLVTLYVAPAAGASLLLNEYVRGRIVVASKEALVAPPAAALPGEEEDTWVLYTVQDGKAVKHEVKVGLTNDKQVELIAKDLKAGQQVVVVGNSQLSDGMAVEVEPGK
jgi:RND family efflux transporter MFP subunit